MTKRRHKPYRPKYVSTNPMTMLFGGMSATHVDHLRELQIKNHLAMAELAQGRGTKAQWDQIVGAINIANVLCEQGFGDEFRAETIAARDAMLEVGKRFMKTGKFVFTGDELQAVNRALDCHDAQLENVRAIDIDRAANEVIRRVRHRINSTSVMREMRKEAA
jgi:hypothetical protein